MAALKLHLFHVLDRVFFREFGFEANIDINLVRPAQCPAVTFVSSTRDLSAATPRRYIAIDIDESKLKTDGVLMGSIAGIGGGNFYLLLVADDGNVRNLTRPLKSNGTASSFEADLPPSKNGSLAPQ
ncbi:MAG TPA: hypothetical protein VLJ17_04750, partial [Xanthobacteraceae bacterium]|nr:hypothetical protein [Xanthobacteraceae bacterium]